MLKLHLRLGLLLFKLLVRAYCPLPVYADYHVHIWFAWITLFCKLETTFCKVSYMIAMVTITIAYWYCLVNIIGLQYS